MKVEVDTIIQRTFTVTLTEAEARRLRSTVGHAPYDADFAALFTALDDALRSS